MDLYISWKKRAALAVLACCLAAPATGAAPALVRVAMSEQMPPVSFVENGMTSGILQELLQALFATLPQYQPQFQPFPWIRAQRMVESGQMDVFVTFPSPTRLAYAHFSAQPVFTLDYGNLVYALDGPHAEKIAQARSFDDLKDLVFVSQEAVEWETDNVPSTIRRTMVNAPNSLIYMTFERKTGDFFIMPMEQAIFFARRLGYEKQLGMKQVPFIPNSIVKFHVGVRKNFPGASQFIAAVDAALKSPVFQKQKKLIEQRYRSQLSAALH